MIHLPPSANPLSDKRDEEYNKKYDEVQSCMMNKGYRYTGSCKGPLRFLLPCRIK